MTILPGAVVLFVLLSGLLAGAGSRTTGLASGRGGARIDDRRERPALQFAGNPVLRPVASMPGATLLES